MGYLGSSRGTGGYQSHYIKIVKTQSQLDKAKKCVDWRTACRQVSVLQFGVAVRWCRTWQESLMRTDFGICPRILFFNGRSMLCVFVAGISGDFRQFELLHHATCVLALLKRRTSILDASTGVPQSGSDIQTANHIWYAGMQPSNGRWVPSNATATCQGRHRYNRFCRKFARTGATDC